MALATLSGFRDWLVSEYRGDGRLDEVLVLEGAEAGGADLAVRLCCAEKSYYEVRVTEEEVEAGFATEARMVNEAIEQMVLDNGGDLSELLSDELCELGGEPVEMEHFFERPAFRYIVRVPLSGPDDLMEEAMKQQVRRLLAACRVLFQDAVDAA
jgi:hypothetical protein